MSRTLKRVPLDFAAPLRKTWSGYLNPHTGRECSICNGSGQSPHGIALTNQWYGKNRSFRPEMRGSVPYDHRQPLVRDIIRAKIERDPKYYGWGEGAITREALRMCEIWNSRMKHHLNDQDVAALIARDRLWEFTHTWSREAGWVPKAPPVVPTAREVNDCSLCGLGHDCINESIVIRAELARLGLPAECADCGGHGTAWPSPEARKLHDEWEPSEPPTGEGFQLWETCSEGSPISPVFPSLDALCLWAEAHATTFASHTATASEWREMLEADCVHAREGSMIFT